MRDLLQVRAIECSANCYVTGSTLIDVGDDAGFLLGELEGASIDLIILTHCHYDHCGAAAEVALKTGAKLAMHAEDAKLIGDSMATVSYMFGSRMPGFSPDILLHGGEHLGSLEVIHTPGHTPGGICLYNSETGTLFSGDTVFSGGGIGRTDLPGGDGAALAGSIERLCGLDVHALYPGHGEASFDGIRGSMNQSLAMSRMFRGF
ncbi:MAG TPA: MBL fold metallo-hydrolase [Candidatus Methanoperedenaceae archaeon]|nr:MBL fold metallo-hydrolase [Candidatus Methanoperedenaceae archaeon]